jgi:hypothetical protein
MEILKCRIKNAVLAVGQDVLRGDQNEIAHSWDMYLVTRGVHVKYT